MKVFTFKKLIDVDPVMAETLSKAAKSRGQSEKKLIEIALIRHLLQADTTTMEEAAQLRERLEKLLA